MRTTPSTDLDAQTRSHLESIRRMIAMARLGQCPKRSAAQSALQILEQMTRQLRERVGMEHIDLHATRAALVQLTWGHLPEEAACIDAMRESLFVLLSLSEQEEAR